MHNSLRLVSWFLVAVVACSSCARRPADAVPTSAAIEPATAAQIAAKLEDRIPELMAEARIPGLGMCLIDNSEIAWCGAFGVTDAGTGATVGPETTFQAASLSKPVFGYTVLRLVDQGTLELDRPLLEYVGLEKARKIHLGNGFADTRVSAITARMALTHTSGFPNWRRNGELELLFDPGEKFSYSGEGIGLLQQTVEEITGSSLEQLAQVETFGPLGMTRSTYTPADVNFSDYAWPHDGTGSVDPHAHDIEARLSNAKPHAAATLTTTARDYARFLIGLIDGVGLEDATYADLVRPQVDVDEDGGVAWGLGIGLERSSAGIRVWHWGDNGDSKAFFVADPAAGRGFVYFANGYNGLSIVGELLDIAMPGDHPLLDGALLDDYPSYDSPEFAFCSAVFTGGAEPAAAFVRKLTTDGTTPPVPEATINDMGYWLLGRDRIDEAIALFELNVELYPESWNVYDSLGEAQLEMGLRDQALANYRRSLELNPDNQNGKRVLEEAGAIVP